MIAISNGVYYDEDSTLNQVVFPKKEVLRFVIRSEDK